MSSYESLKRQADALFEQAAELRNAEREQAIADIKAAILLHDIPLKALGGALVFKVVALPGRGPKFRGPQGETWSGRGPRPGWAREIEAAGGSLETYRV